MAIIYMPEDRRWSGLGNALGGAVAQGIDTSMRQKRFKQITDILNDPGGATPPQGYDPADPLSAGSTMPSAASEVGGGQDDKLMRAMAATKGDPEMMQFVKNVQAMHVLSAQMKHYDVETQTALAKLGMMPLEQQKLLAQADQATAGAAHSRAETEAIPTRTAADVSRAQSAARNADSSAISARASMARAGLEQQRLQMQRDQMAHFNETFSQYIKPVADGVAAHAEDAAQEPIEADPTSGYGQGYNLKTDALSRNIPRLSMAWGAKSIPPGRTISASAQGRTIKVEAPKPISDQDQKEVSGMLSFSQTTRDLFEMLRDKGDQLNTGPGRAAIQGFINRFAQNLSDIEPNISYQDAIEHQTLSVAQATSSIGRQGIQVLNMLKGITASTGMGKAQALDRIRKGTRLMRNQAGALAGRAVGGNLALDPEVMQEIDRNTLEVLKKGGEKEKGGAAAPSGGGAEGGPGAPSSAPSIPQKMSNGKKTYSQADIEETAKANKMTPDEVVRFLQQQGFK